MFDDELEQVGLVLGLEPATTTEFRILIDEANYLQLDDLVVVETEVPKAGTVRTYGVVTEVASRHEGGRLGGRFPYRRLLRSEINLRTD